MLNNELYKYLISSWLSIQTPSIQPLWVIDWLLFNANSEMFQLYHAKNKLIFDEIKVSSALY
jgi:hypothetical protein